VGLVGQRLRAPLGLVRVLTGLWLMHMTFALTLTFASGFHLTV
jgi:hypothetical protein